jgi:Tol biopolymer transport system component
MRRLLALVTGTLLLLAGCTSQKPHAILTPSPASSRSTPLTQAPGAWALFFRLEADSSCQTTVSRLVRAQPSGALVSTGIPWMESDHGYVSADGRKLAIVQRRGQQTILRVGEAGASGSLPKLLVIPDGITSVLWSADGRTLYFMASPYGREGTTERLESIEVGSKRVRLLSMFPNAGPRFHKLLGLRSDGQTLVWIIDIADGAGGAQDLGVTDLRSRTSRSIGSSLRTEYNGYALSLDRRTLYWMRDAKSLVARSLDTGADRVLYTRGRARVRAPVVAPDGSSLVFQDTDLAFTQFDATSSTVTVTLSLDVSSGRVRVLRRAKSQMASEQPVAWSPDGRWVWFADESQMKGVAGGGCEAGRTDILDFRNKRWLSFREGQTVARVLVGWIQL